MNEEKNKIDESQIADLLQQVGVREVPPQDLQDEIKANVKATWLNEVKAQQQQQRHSKQKKVSFIFFALAASLVIAIGLNLQPSATVQHFASVTQTVNQIQYENEQGNWQNLSNNEVYPSTKMRTLDGSYASITFSNGLNMRLDANTEIELIDLTEVIVATGSIYVDSNAELTNNTILVSTPFGRAQDIGTQFEVKVMPTHWRVQVRDGSVEMVDGKDQFLLAAGERIQISKASTASNNVVQKSIVSAHDNSWSWTQSVSTPFKLEGETLDHYLSWVGRETGDEIRYRSTETESEAKRTKLHGSLQGGAFKGLTPKQSVAKVLKTTKFTATLTTHGVIFVDKKHK